MKTLRKVSFENFNRLSIIEASQLYGGTGDNPPTPTVPTESTQVNKSDSIPPTKTTPKHTVSAGVKQEANKSTTVTGSYTVTTGSGVSVGGTVTYNNKNGVSYGVTGSYTFGGGKKK